MASGHAEVVARTFLTSWVCQYGAPKRLVTDRGKNLVGAVFKRLCEFLGTKHTPTCTYRPQGNAQNERAHKELHQYIAMYLSEATNAANWDLLLNHAAWVHNSSYHTVLKRSPLEVLTGVKPRNGADFLPGNHPDRESRDLTFEEYYAMKSEQLQNLQEQARLAIAKAQAVTRENLNKHARVPNYKIGDEVWVKTHGVKTIDSKWAKRYEGPWVVKEVISPQVLKLVQKDDPSKIDIVHTTYIRKKYDRVETSDDSDSEGDDSDSDARSDYLDYSDDDSDHGDNSSNSPQRPRVVPTGPRPNSESRRTNITHSPPQKPSTSSTPSWWPDPLKRIVKALSPSKNTSAQNGTNSSSIPIPPSVPSTSQATSSLSQNDSSKSKKPSDKNVSTKTEKKDSNPAEKGAKPADKATKKFKTSRFVKKSAPPTPGKNLSASSDDSLSSSSASISSQSSSLIPQQGSITGANSNQRVDRPLPRFQLFDERVDNNSSRTSAVVTAPKPAGDSTQPPALDDDDAPDMMP
jgi:hypothetical protein